MKPAGVFDATIPSHLGGVDKLPAFSNVRVFRDGFSPNWEDYKNGGQLSMRLKKDSTLRNWKMLVETIMDGRMPHLDHIAGLVLSIRPGSNAAHIWCVDSNMIQKNSEIMKFVLAMMNVHIVYVPFQVLKQRNIKQKEKMMAKAIGGKNRTSSDNCDMWSEASTETLESERKNISMDPNSPSSAAPSDGTRTPALSELDYPATPVSAAAGAPPAPSVVPADIPASAFAGRVAQDQPQEINYNAAVAVVLALALVGLVASVVF